MLAVRLNPGQVLLAIHIPCMRITKDKGKRQRIHNPLRAATATAKTTGFCVFNHTLCQGTVPSVYDDKDNVIVFSTEMEAQREIVDHAMIRLRQFLDGERDFEDAILIEEFVVEVDPYFAPVVRSANQR